MERDKDTKDADQVHADVETAPAVNRRSFSLLAASVPAVFALSCKTPAGKSEVKDASAGDSGDTEFGKNTNFTTSAFGEEGGKDLHGTTRKLGEEGGATTRALGEEGGKGGFVTSQALGEEGGPGVGDEKWGPVATTQALNEESSGDGDSLGKIPTVTSRKLSEEGGADTKHIMTSMALGEEGGKGGGNPIDGGKNAGGGKAGLSLAGDKDNFVTSQALNEEGGGKNDIVTSKNRFEEGGDNNDQDVVLTSAALGEESTGNKDNLYLSTRQLSEEGSSDNDADRVKDVRATSLAVGEEGGKAGGSDKNGNSGKDAGQSGTGDTGLPSQQVAMIIIQAICNKLGVNIRKVDIETRVTRTGKELLWINYSFETLQNEETVEHKVNIKWLEDWNDEQFAMFSEKQIKGKLGLN